MYHYHSLADLLLLDGYGGLDTDQQFSYAQQNGCSDMTVQVTHHLLDVWTGPLTSVFIHRHRERSGEGEVATGALNQRVMDAHVQTLCVPDDGTQLTCVWECRR